jgi:hypothetical protein
VPTQQRSLQLYDPRIAERYEGSLNKQLAYHKLESKINTIHSQSTTSSHSPNTPQQYETIDKLLGDSMAYSEKNASKVFSTRFEWSPVLSRAVNTLWFWTVCLKRAKGIRVSDAKLYTLQTLGGIDITTLPPVLTLPIIVKHLCISRKMLKDIQKRHVEHRQLHLKSLAEAIVKKKNPTLPYNERFEKKTKRTIHSIIRKERLKKCIKK